ncbi:hypothetical protein [Pseudoduganella sp. OTU4001]
MKIFFVLLVLAVAAFWFFGDPQGSLARISTWACEWMGRRMC